MNINRYFLLLFDITNQKTKIIRRELNSENKLDTREIELVNEIKAIKLLNTKYDKDNKYYCATFFVKKLNNEKILFLILMEIIVLMI